MKRNWAGVGLWPSTVLVLCFTSINILQLAVGFVRKAFVYRNTTENIS